MGLVYLLVVLALAAVAILWWVTGRPSEPPVPDDGPPLLEPDGDWEQLHLQQLDAATTARPGRPGIVAGLAIAGVIGLGAVVAQAIEPVRELVATATPSPEPSAEPLLITIEVTPAPTPEPTPTPTPAPTPVPTAPPAPRPTASAAPAPSAPAEALTVSTSTSCDAGTVQVNYTFHGHEGLRWFTVYLDGETVRGGPVSGTEHSGSWAGDAASGEHDIEVVVEDTADGRAVSRKLVICP